MVALKSILVRIRDVILYYMPKPLAHTFFYNKFHDNRIDFRNPVTYDEKIHWLMSYVYDKQYGKYADKISVRDYVTSCGLSGILIPLVGEGVYSSPYDINLDELPSQFIIKTNHASGDKYYLICNDKEQIKPNEVIERFNKALKTNFAIHFCQYHYAGIKPRLICEKLLVEGEHQRLTDFKVVCSFGTPIAILVCKDRSDGRDYYSPNWEYLDYVKPEYRSGAKMDKPELLSEMLAAASILSKPFPLARIDFYVVDNHLYFGEITLTPSQGNTSYLNEKGQKEIGMAIKLNKSF